MKGDIWLGDKVILSGIEVNVQIGSNNWQGLLTIDDPSRLVTGRQYQLKLADGRSGRILISGMSSSSRSGMSVVKFTGSGPLE